MPAATAREMRCNPAMFEVWATGAGIPGLAARHAAAVEQAGYDGLALVDSQNLAGDCYVGLALAAKATTRLRLATGVTNPVTRHPAATAAAIAAIHAESGGRAVLGIGRGDSSLAHLGYAPAPVPVFERALERIQGYLRGDEVPFDADANLAHARARGRAEGEPPRVAPARSAEGAGRRRGDRAEDDRD